MKALLKLLLTSLLVCASGCALRPLDAPWDPDPRSGRSLMDQIPNWDGEAERRCGGHLTKQERDRKGLSDRC